MASNAILEEPFEFTKEFQNPDDTEGLTCELKTYEARYNSQGERVNLQVGARRQLEKKADRDHDSALILTRYYGRDKELEGTLLEIRSPYLKTALREVIKDYPGVNLYSGRIVLRELPKCLFHYRKELQSYGATLHDPEAVRHVLFGLRYMYKTLHREISTYYNLMEISNSLAPGLDFENLWMAFRPGDLIHVMSDNVDRVLRQRSMSRCPCPQSQCTGRDWKLEAENILCNGKDFGYITQTVSIAPYDGYRALQNLHVLPLDYHPEKERITRNLLERGRRFISLLGVHYRWYEGAALALSESSRNSALGQPSMNSITIRSRIMIDCEEFYVKAPKLKPQFSYSVRTISTKSQDHHRLSDEDILICHYQIPGFSLVNKRWCYFEVDKIQDIEFNSGAFEALMLSQEEKHMINSLVKVHTDKGMHFDDVIRGKGKGMVFLLHGTTGVGKTLTAESVADHTRRPLYTISSGDLGINATLVEDKLCSALELATTWEAIVLIDEADVFLEERSPYDLERNGLVSVFLRVLEYYEGIMFLTTNRICAFDPAFKSRIHLAIRYPHLSPTCRRELWKTFITGGCPQNMPQWIDDSVLAKLESQDLNGRQIKNIVRTAYAVAWSTGSELALKHITMGLKAIRTFEADLTEEAAKNNSQYDNPPAPKRPRHG
ncbi:P-loop containing nucleoside triphosphate hydrolase protein [Zopfia rhizophila CBS 207.26]|uniref:P-loop containing nucleoside triphosphate hydrolase protein n=1 Tax=Zopfia rhizophila CBS 207.26 TaxID=1314779 RepID=A0A6A6ET48_9PEZI|nr:P-loop containing nucleoside triphosphate hydrolase protein [Zopfia rhizophila CBS 207.26]